MDIFNSFLELLDDAVRYHGSLPWLALIIGICFFWWLIARCVKRWEKKADKFFDKFENMADGMGVVLAFINEYTARKETEAAAAKRKEEQREILSEFQRAQKLNPNITYPRTEADDDTD